MAAIHMILFIWLNIDNMSFTIIDPPVKTIAILDFSSEYPEEDIIQPKQKTLNSNTIPQNIKNVAANQEYEETQYANQTSFDKQKAQQEAIESIKKLDKQFDLYILSTAPWDNPNAWKQKRDWIGKYFGDKNKDVFYKKVILSHNKNLNKGDYLIDDRPNNGAENFEGEWIKFGSKEFPDWKTVTKFLL